MKEKDDDIIDKDDDLEDNIISTSYNKPNVIITKEEEQLSPEPKIFECELLKKDIKHKVKFIIKERERLMTDLYDLLCKFTHASIVVSVFNSIKSKEEKTVLRILLSYNLYFVKIILMKCLNYFTKIDDSEINEETIGISVLLGYIKIYYKIKKNNISFEEIKESFYYDTLNKQFYDYYSDLINKELYNDIMLFEKNENNIEVALRAFFNK